MADPSNQARFVTRRPGSVLAPSAAGLLAAGVLAAGLLGGDTPAMAAPAAPWRVAVLMGSDAGLPAMHEVDRSFRRTLQAAAPAGATFFTDTLDTYRFDYGDLAPEFLALQRKKYAGRPVDLVVGVGERAIDAVREQRDALWPGVPLILAGLDEPMVERARVPVGALQSFWQLDIAGTLALIERLQPAATRLIVVSGNAEGDLALGARVGALATTRGRWRIEPWAGLPITALRERLERLGPETAVFFTHVSRDANGPTPFPAEVLTQLAATSGAPIYGLFGSFVGRGLAAGSVVDFEAAGRLTATLAIALLEGRPPPAVAPDATTRCTADLGLFARHGLDSAALPAGCTTVNPPRNLWTEYRAFVLVSSAVVAAQALTIGGLLVQRRRRRQAEAEAGQRRLELARAMRFAAMGELTASIAHEINQPLGAILSNADAADLMLRNGGTPNDALRASLHEILADIRRDDLRAHEVIRRLRALLEHHEVTHVPLGLHPALREALGLLEPEARRRGIVLEAMLDATDDRIVGDPVQLQQVLLNLAINAMDAMDAGDRAHAGPRRVSIATADRDGELQLTVADTGSGIPAGHHESVFESFFTTKPRGMGLGLGIVRAIVESHGGRVTLEPRDGGGTLARVRLLRARPDAGAPRDDLRRNAPRPAAALAGR
ncbi:MAG: sensor histidine kinase [Burkholderiales bacterium]|nr:sensor histidine kinase [Burkholderiales bacterium]